MKNVMTMLIFSLLALAAPVIAETDDSCALDCKKCAAMCEKTLDYCQKKGGAHAAADHIRTMKDCITMCKTSDELNNRHSSYVSQVKKICAQICADCAASCEKLKDANLKDCIAECKKCSNCCKH